VIIVTGCTAILDRMTMAFDALIACHGFPIIGKILVFSGLVATETTDVGIAENIWAMGEVSEAREWFFTVRVWLPPHLFAAVLEADMTGRTRSGRVY